MVEVERGEGERRKEEIKKLSFFPIPSLTPST